MHTKQAAFSRLLWSFAFQLNQAGLSGLIEVEGLTERNSSVPT